jgi:hypothetical protein
VTNLDYYDDDPRPGMSRRQQIAMLRDRYQRQARARSAVSAVVLLAALVAIAVAFIVILNQSSGNINCKKQQASQYELCVSGQPVYVPYPVWRSARVGGYYDTGTGRVFHSADDDPAAPHARTGTGSGGDDGHAVFGGEAGR